MPTPSRAPRALRPARLLAAAALGAGLCALSACESAPGVHENHWTIAGLEDRVSWNVLSYRPHRDGSYRQHVWQQKQDINMTVRRHFFGHNPLNPLQPYDHDLDDPRPPHSVAPDPISYFHLEALAWGGITLAATGAFIPIPVGSVIATLTPGGPSEFVEGFEQTFRGEFEGTIGEPPPVSEFRVIDPISPARTR